MLDTTTAVNVATTDVTYDTINWTGIPGQDIAETLNYGMGLLRQQAELRALLELGGHKVAILNGPVIFIPLHPDERAWVEKGLVDIAYFFGWRTIF